jgi:hypothetical protein
MTASRKLMMGSGRLARGHVKLVVVICVKFDGLLS